MTKLTNSYLNGQHHNRQRSRDIDVEFEVVDNGRITPLQKHKDTVMFSWESVGYKLAELQLKQHHIFNWRRLWTKTRFNEWEAEPPASMPFNGGSLCEPREIDTQWGLLALFCWAEKQQVEKAVKTYQRCNYVSFQVFLEAGTWVSHREAHLIFTYSCNC